ncbi:MAG: DnaJ domain-containing protein [Desulfovibrionaceae bacterium]|nr:DnaJ domain-containing protein [Desulfovibrionaceae bacterium]
MKASSLSLKECYAILGVAHDSDLETVKHAYRKRAFELHPDLNPSDGASRAFQELNEAYVTLLRFLAPPASSSATGAEAGGANARTGRNAYAEQARREREERERREAERREKKEQERRERREQERIARERREKEEKERREAERRERLQREIDRQEAERLARQAKAKEEKARRDEALRAAEREREEKLREAERQRSAGPRPEAYRRTYSRPSGPGSEEQAAPPHGAPSGTGGETPGRGASESGFGSADSSREELLQELLNDPFARRVYEDIYSEVRNRQNTPAKPAPQPRKIQMEWGDKTFQVDLTGGIGHAIKGWMRNQIDEEQELFFPAANLFPGARIRLQIRHGFSGELRTVDITLPQDFVPGKPIRLKGMGKKLGRWQGDLYLTFQIKERGDS